MMVTMSPHQYGGVKGRSTTDAILALKERVKSTTSKYALGVFVDISGAFDNLWWPSILCALKEIHCPLNIFNLLRDYFQERKVFVPLPSGRVRHTVTKGCPQGSVLGPFLWNLVFNSLLVELEVQGYAPVAFVDDLAVIVEGRGRKDLQEKTITALGIINNWCKEKKLSLSTRKTKMLILKGCIKPINAFKILIDGTTIPLSEEVRYLGVTFGERLNLGPHMRELKASVIRRYGCLLSIARNTWGLNNRNRILLYKALYLPMVSYAAPAWYSQRNKKSTAMLLQTQRKALLLVTRAFKTVSTDALQVLAGQLPVDLELDLRTAKYNIQRGMSARVGSRIFTAGSCGYDELKPALFNAAVSQWQERWQTSSKGRTTFAFLPDVKERMEKEWHQLDFATSQLLSGHGDIGYKLDYFRLEEHPNCKCGVVETIEHVIIHYPNYNSPRMQLAGEFSLLEWPPSSVSQLLANEVIYKALKEKSRGR